MIPRTLVPREIRPASEDAAARPPRRRSTSLDARALVPADLPRVSLDGRTSIPAHLPLEVLAARVVVPRDMPAAPLDTARRIPEHVPLTVLDSRVVIPKNLPPVLLGIKGPFPPERLPTVLEPDVITTGEVNLLVKPVAGPPRRWNWSARALSIAAHALLIVFILLQPKLFPYRPPTQAELELARRQLGLIYLPPPVTEVPRIPSPPEATSPRIRIDPRILRQVIPPSAEPEPLPGPREPERVQRDLPTAPTPQLPQSESQARAAEPPRLENPKEPQSPSGLLLPRLSPGKALEESLRGAVQERGEGSGLASGGRIPRTPGGGGGGEAYGAVQLLTPTEGVDFTNYLARVLASVKRNWYAVIPESARLGEKGKVVLQFHILRDGSVPFPEPALMATSGKEPLDRAAMSSIRASSPFEPLPPAFSGPYIELRFIFLYNLPLDYQ